MQWRLAIVAALIAATFASGWYLGGLKGRLVVAERAYAQSQKDLAAVAESQKRADKLQEKLDKLPKAERKHADVVRSNPAGCDRAAPVADSLQESVDTANRARALPSDS